MNNMKVGLERGENTKRLGKLEARELNEAEIELIKSVQDELVSELGVKEQREILRCVGRLVNSDLDFDARRLITLPKKHHLTKLIIQDCHEVYTTVVRGPH